MNRLFFCIFLLLGGMLNSSDYQVLDAMAFRAGADKASSYHNYTEAYAHFFAPLRDKPIKLLEIGICKGASVRLWEEYFPNAELHFMDINLSSAEYYSIRSHYHLCDQENPKDLQRFIEETRGKFDIIIDDGGHTMNQQMTSFSSLFPHIKSGGMYIIEDLHTSYWPEFGGGKAKTMVNFLKSLIDDLNFIGAKTGRASHLNPPPASLRSELTSYRTEIASMHFYDSLVVIIKR